MADRTVLVVGDVTSQQYHDASLSVLERDHQPKIVHVSAEDFFLDALGLVKTYDPTNAQRYDMAGVAEIMELLRDLADKHLDSYGTIGAIVMDETVWENWSTRSSTFVESAVNTLDEYAPRWAVINGQVQYIG